MDFPDFVASPNQRDLAIYEIENRSVDHRGALLDAIRAAAPWAHKVVVDLGCGSGFWLTTYSDAAKVVGVEPDHQLLAAARQRDTNIEVLHGSAEHIPLSDGSVDIIHARFAYFFPPGCEAGYDEAIRVLRPQGTLVVIDNDLRHGEFAELVVRSSWAESQGTASGTDAWWRQRGASRTEVMSDWTFDSRADMEAVLRLELPSEIVNPWLAEHPDRLHISYGFVVFAVVKPKE